MTRFNLPGLPETCSLVYPFSMRSAIFIYSHFCALITHYGERLPDSL